MQKYLLTTTLAIIGSFVVGSSALAAPGVVYKKQLSVPTVPATTLNKIAAMGWQYPTTASSTNGFGTFKNVVLLKPQIISEKECGGVMYRMWAISMDRDATMKTQPLISTTQAPFYNLRFGTRYVFEARTPSLVKWSVDPMYKGIYDLDHPNPQTLFSCDGKNIVIAYEIHNPRNGDTTDVFRTVHYSSFETNTEWSGVTNIVKLKSVTDADGKFLKDVDGILQYPGYLSVTKDRIIGDSRPITASSKGLLYHTVPHYRDLTSLSPSTNIRANFYRMHDGYGVREVSYNTETYEGSVSYYRIKNGEASYTKVDTLDTDNNISIRQDVDGIFFFKSPYTKVSLVHGLPATGYTSQSNIVWETSEQAYIRYTITNTSTSKQQYWEATVNKK